MPSRWRVTGAGLRRYKLTGETGSYRYMAPVRILGLLRETECQVTRRMEGC